MKPVSPTQEFLHGFRAEMPILVAVVPFGMIYGALAISAGMPFVQAQAMSAILFAGSAQFITAQLYQSYTPGLVIILTIAVVNLRHALYSASIAPFIKQLNWRWKWLLAYLLTDEAYAVAITNYLADPQPEAHGGETGAQRRQPRAYQHWFFLGAGFSMWITWQLSTTAGILLGAIIPDSWALDFALALTFIALVAPSIKDRPSLAAALSAGLVGVAAFALPYKLGLVLAALVGIAAGMLLETWGQPKASLKCETQE
jgi:4-azaleucine resistance transporter AzlC